MKPTEEYTQALLTAVPIPTRGRCRSGRSSAGSIGMHSPSRKRSRPTSAASRSSASSTRERAVDKRAVGRGSRCCSPPSRDRPRRLARRRRGGAGGAVGARASMSQRRSYIAAAKLDDHVYTAGGMVGETGRPLALASRYDAEADRWEVLPRLPVETRAAARGAQRRRGSSSSAGRRRRGTPTPSGRYDPAARSGRRSGAAARAALQPRRRPPSTGRSGCARRLLEGEERREVYVYDPETDTVGGGPPLPRAMHAFGAVPFRGELWVIGGPRRRGDPPHVWISTQRPASGARRRCRSRWSSSARRRLVLRDPRCLGGRRTRSTTPAPAAG